MKRRRIKIQADFIPSGLGLAYIEPVPSVHPPSLHRDNGPISIDQAPVERVTKLMQRLLKEDQKRLDSFRMRLLQHQPKNVMPMTQTTFFDPSPIFTPPLFFSSQPRNKRRKLYNKVRKK